MFDRKLIALAVFPYTKIHIKYELQGANITCRPVLLLTRSYRNGCCHDPWRQGDVQSKTFSLLLTK